jgi:hypothetical protein
MFVKLLTLLFSNLFVGFLCFSVQQVVNKRMRFEDGKLQKEPKVPVSVIEHMELGSSAWSWD